MQFEVDKIKNTIHIRRKFAAPVENVWKAYTKSELLDRWWAPRPWQTRTKSMDFREGGHWLYAMLGPKGKEHWCRADYLAISTYNQFSLKDGFCDADGNVNEDMPRSQIVNSFKTTAGGTIVDSLVTYSDLADLEKVIQMGMKEGIKMAMDNLDELLAA